MASGRPPRRAPRLVAALRRVPYVVAVLITLCGVALVCGLLTLRAAGGARVRVTLGVVAMLYGVLRVVQLRQRAAAQKEAQ